MARQDFKADENAAEWLMEEVDEFELDDMEEQGGFKQPRWQTHKRTSWHVITAHVSKRFMFIVSLCVVIIGGLAWLHLPKRLAIPDPSTMSNAIDSIITDADKTFSAVIEEGNPQTVAIAAASYRRRRGRHPFPGFDKWFAWAQENNCVQFESIFDQVYEDIEPFWGVDPAKVRADAQSWPLILSVRNGTVTRRRMLPDVFGSRDYAWEDMLKQIPAESLPDVDIPLNTDDKAHIFVPWEEINEYIKEASKARKLRPVDDMSQEYSSLPAPAEATFQRFNDYPSEENLWLLVRDTCHPDSPARRLVQDADLTTPPRFHTKDRGHLSAGFVANWTASKSPCDVPSIRNTHGFFANSFPGSHMYQRQHHTDESVSSEVEDRLVTRQFFPVFSAGKIVGSNNDILIPPATSWGEDYFRQDNVSWDDKDNEIFWRGSATGGKNNRTNWTRFHRHRLLSMTNGTQVDLYQAHPTPPSHVPGGDPPLPYNIPLVDAHTYPIAVASNISDAGRWINSWSETGFTDLSCDEQDPGAVLANWSKTCPYSSHWYESVDRKPMELMYQHKYLLDVDGHGYSGRFRSLMDSDSVPIKATIWAEWSSSRLWAWKHFVPMDNTFMDLYGLVEYFIGYAPPPGESREEEAREGHDRQAKAIADAGRYWSQLVLRKEDMVLYLWRVVLEYARAVDDRREELGFVQDLIEAAHANV